MKCFIFLLLVLCVISANRATSAQTANFLDPIFAPVIEQNTSLANVIVKQPNGKILVGGYFTLANNKINYSLARFNPDGSLDESFNAAISASNGSVRAIVAQPDGKILVGVQFATATGVVRNIIRLNADGSEDTSFTAAANSFVYAIALQSDGKIIIGGAFTTVNSQNRFSLARLNADGTLDTTFNPSFSQGFGIVFAIAIQSDGSIIFGGNIRMISPVITRIARTSSSGIIDIAFSANASVNSNVKAIKLQSDGAILIGGGFTTVNGVSRTGIARLNTNGTLDSSFAPTLAGSAVSVESVDIDTNNQILFGGTFTSVNGIQRFNAAKLNGSGSLDTTFVPSNTINATVNSVIAESDGSTLIGGRFRGFDGTIKSHIARLNQNGSVSSLFNAKINVTGLVNDIELQPDGKIIAAGAFSYVNNSNYSLIARFLPDGTIDPSFVSPLTQVSDSFGIEDVEILSNGKIVVVGAITLSSDPSITIYHAVRLNSNGTLDNTFAPVITNGDLKRVKALPNGQLLVSGNFTELNGTNKNAVAKINSDGSLDNSFTVNLTATTALSINAISVRSDGKILIGGNFNTVNGTTRSSLALLNQNGTLDPSFTANTSSNTAVSSIEMLSDGNLLVNGTFTAINGIPRNRAAKLSATGQVDPNFDVVTALVLPVGVTKTLPSGQIIIAGFSTSANLVVLNANGSLNTLLPNDRGFNDNIFDVEVQNNGNILLGGRFTKIGSSVRYGLARFSSTNFSSKTIFDFDGDGKADVSVFRPENGSWYILQSQAGFAGLQFGLSTDKLVPADYDGDGKTDVAVVRNGNWYLQRSTAGFTGIQFGDANDVPVPADYDGDGKAELAVFRPSNGYWYVLNITTNQFTATQFGISTDKPVAADYDGDGKTDIAVNRNGNWYIQRSQLGFTGVLFGDSNDKTVPADYDGDGRADIAVFRPSNGTWYLQQSTAGFTGIAFGLGTDIPVAADYDGDGKADVAVVRNGNWYLNRSSQGFTGIQFGTATDSPIPNTFVR